jgi:hypothetical protein
LVARSVDIAFFTVVEHAASAERHAGQGQEEQTDSEAESHHAAFSLSRDDT